MSERDGAVVCNEDRHGANFGMLRDNATGAIVGMAPLFDHNLALFPHEPEDGSVDLFERSQLSFWPSNSWLGFTKQAGVVMGERQRDQVARLTGFEFENHPRFPISEKRLAALNEYLSKRVAQLLSLPVVDEKILAKDLAAIPLGSRGTSSLEIVGMRAGI